MDLIIEKDEHAAEVFEGQMGGATHGLQDALGIDEATAHKLLMAGFPDASMVVQADVDDLTEILEGDSALAGEIYQKAQALASA
jgi:N utilization substance protein A